ncbi:Starch-binding associating with outer membrane [Mariniphaga anaerophila]|uniref:Starch-binding associating with outer membrane n=1 Tax=Mariniphaga anaerophila TaxID=1484053 RepID=A0A1M4SR36_9BACT|nr:RagB/SusD family nutrient uptake outer membrane protein [Mariniphaga anaerophila]SHE34649.1 Starch-binding associating with outer membrane [Mariniphaga anaerophila]
MRRLYAIVAIMIMILASCSDDYLFENPPNSITTKSLYSSIEGFETGINGLYSRVRYEFQWISSISLLPANLYLVGTDNYAAQTGSAFMQISRDWGDVNNSQVSDYENIFLWLYSVINAANTIINQAESRDDINWFGGNYSADENKNRSIAEAKAIRAWAYRHLSYGWGDVPLSLNESLGSTIKTDWERTPVKLVRKQIISDLLFAQKYLDDSPKVRGRISKGAAQHYLAEMYITLDMPDSTLYWTNQVISNSNYKLITERYGVKADQPGVPFMDMFYDGNTNREEGNTEALWVWQYQYGVTGGAGSFLRYLYGSRYWAITVNGVTPLQISFDRGGRPMSYASLTRWAWENYEPQDDRGSQHVIRKYFILKEDNGELSKADLLPSGYNYGDTIWLDTSGDITTNQAAQRYSWPFCRKFLGSSPVSLTDTYEYVDKIYLRLAETYLLKAEAQFMLGSNQEAANTINILRRRSNASDITSDNINMDFILDERSRELLQEEHRRYTLLRTGKWLERVKKYNKRGGEFITDRDLLFPIPESVINTNLTKEMPQNPGF